MAEERIYAYYYKKHPCDGCEAKEVYDGCNCPVLEEYEMSITRQEAIEKMARAICRAGENECIGDCASCDLWKVGPEKDYAEAALNALLEMKK